jgi:predicted permease
MNGDIKSMTPSKIFLNPGIIGVVIGLIIFTSPLYIHIGDTAGVRLPQIILDALSSMSALNLPLPMLMIGYYLAKADIISAFKDGWLYVCVALRLIIFPLIALGMMLALGIGGNVFLVCVIGAAAPVGTTTTIFAAKFNRDIELSVKLESVSTVLSLITMPIVVSVAQYLM